MSLRALLPPGLFRLAQIFAQTNFPLYAVGSFVRNGLLNLPVTDVDVCSGLLPEKVIALLQGTPYHVKPIGGHCGTLAITYDEKGQKQTFEYTPFRRDVYIQGYHRPADVFLGVDVKTDALRRDFSINALYYHILNDEICDWVGGLDDLRLKQIRAVNDPHLVFGEDGLRILRLVRFACELGFEPESKTFEAARQHGAYLADIVPDRIRDEVCKILLSDIKYPSLQLTNSPEKGLFLLKDLGVLGYIFPELLAGAGVAQRKDYHAYDVFTHNVKTMSYMPPVLYLRLAGLLHDIGKTYCLQKTGQMKGHERESAQLATHRLTALRFDKATLSRVEKIIFSHMYDLNGQAKTAKVRRYFAKIGLDTAKDLWMMRGADVRGSGYITEETPSERKFKTIYQQMIQEGVPDSPDHLALSGKDIMALLGIGPGPRVGEIKKQLYHEVVLRPELNTPEALRRRLLRMKEKLKNTKKGDRP